MKNIYNVFSYWFYYIINSIIYLNYEINTKWDI